MTTVFDGLIDDMRVYAKAFWKLRMKYYIKQASFDNTGKYLFRRDK